MFETQTAPTPHFRRPHGTCSRAIKAWGRPDGFLRSNAWGVRGTQGQEPPAQRLGRQRHAGARTPARCPMRAVHTESIQLLRGPSAEWAGKDKDHGGEKRTGKSQAGLSNAFIFAPFPGLPRFPAPRSACANLELKGSSGAYSSRIQTSTHPPGPLKGNLGIIHA